MPITNAPTIPIAETFSVLRNAVEELLDGSR